MIMVKKNNLNVFINCPFDEDYDTKFRALTFTILACGFIPRCSLEIDSGTESRLDGIISIISDCIYGIHDLSRIQRDKKNGLPRFNMPFELGLFYSAKKFGGKEHKNKKCIILDKNKYRYQKFLSDISGMDISAHGNTIKDTVQSTRNWLLTSSKEKLPSGELISKEFKLFLRFIKKSCQNQEREFDSMPFIEFTLAISDWLKLKKILPKPFF